MIARQITPTRSLTLGRPPLRLLWTPPTPGLSRWPLCSLILKRSSSHFCAGEPEWESENHRCWRGSSCAGNPPLPRRVGHLAGPWFGKVLVQNTTKLLFLSNLFLQDSDMHECHVAAEGSSRHPEVRFMFHVLVLIVCLCRCASIKRVDISWTSVSQRVGSALHSVMCCVLFWYRSCLVTDWASAFVSVSGATRGNCSAVDEDEACPSHALPLSERSAVSAECSAAGRWCSQCVHSAQCSRARRPARGGKCLCHA